MTQAGEAGWLEVPYWKWSGERLIDGEDPLVVEEPIEFRILDQAVAAVMRTPGEDLDLALGHFFTEGWISSPADIGALCVCSRPAAGGHLPPEANVVNLIPAAGRPIAGGAARRAGPATSSCGVCGKQTIDEILRSARPLAAAGAGAPAAGPRIDPAVLLRLPEAMRQRQPLFGRTGALHAAGIFDLEGRALAVKEDIGRHNAVDKAIGCLLRAGRLPLDRHVLVISGRASFEIIQKALRAGIPVVAAVSGVSSLAVELAERGGVTLCGFTRGACFSSYAHPGRIAAPGK